MDRKRVNSVAELPGELEMEILARLPARTLFRCKAVCRNWRDTIKSRVFGRMQLSFNKKNHVEKVVLMDQLMNLKKVAADEKFYATYFYVDGKLVDPPPLAGTYVHAYPCDGIMLLVAEIQEKMALWNPTTGKTREIPYPPFISKFGAHFCGFHHDSASGKFRIFIVRLRCLLGRRCPVLQVFDSDSGSDWKAVDIPSHVGDMCNTGPFGLPHQRLTIAFIRGGFHFLGNELVVRLSLEGEITTLPGRLPPHTEDHRLTVWSDCLCLYGEVYAPPYNINYRYEVWRMEEYGNADSWNRVFWIPMQVPVPLPPLCFSPLQNGCRLDVCRDPVMRDGVPPLYFLGKGRRVLHDFDTDALAQIPPLPELPELPAPSRGRVLKNFLLTCTESLLDP